MGKSLSDLLREKRKAALDELNKLTSVEAADFTPEAEARATELSTELASFEERIAGQMAAEALRAQADAAQAEAATGTPAERKTGGATVTREERTYTLDKQLTDSERFTSFFSDTYQYQQGDMAARSRLERHANEVRAEGEISKRATTTSSFAGLVVPQYLVDQAALLARAGRPVADSVMHMPLPDGGMSLLIPRGTTGASAAVQATENSSVSSTDEVWANVSVPVITVAGQQDVSRQSLERGTPGIDQLIYNDLAGAYSVAVDQQVINGSGSSGQCLGILNTAGINQASAYTAAGTMATFASKFAGQLNAVQTSRFAAATVSFMHPRRWYWLVSQPDTTGRPLVVPSTQGPFNALGVYDGQHDVRTATAQGAFLSVPVVLDASIPTAVGTGPEDQVIVARASDLILWEVGDGMPQQLRFEQTLGNQLTVKLVAYNYIAFTAGRYPTSVGVTGGNAGTIGFGQVAPSF